MRDLALKFTVISMSWLIPTCLFGTFDVKKPYFVYTAGAVDCEAAIGNTEPPSKELLKMIGKDEFRNRTERLGEINEQELVPVRPDILILHSTTDSEEVKAAIRSLLSVKQSLYAIDGDIYGFSPTAKPKLLRIPDEVKYLLFEKLKWPWRLVNQTRFYAERNTERGLVKFFNLFDENSKLQKPSPRLLQVLTALGSQISSDNDGRYNYSLTFPLDWDNSGDKEFKLVININANRSESSHVSLSAANAEHLKALKDHIFRQLDDDSSSFMMPFLSKSTLDWESGNPDTFIEFLNHLVKYLFVKDLDD